MTRRQDKTLDIDPRSVPPMRIGSWQVQPALNRMTDNGQTVQVEPRIMHVLVCLASRPGEVLSRSVLLDSVWDEVVVAEEALTVAISELRRIFGDDPRSPRYIETIRKGGYRLVAPVEPIQPATPQPALSTVAGPPPTEHRPPRKPGQLLWLALAVAVAAGAVGLLLRSSDSDPVAANLSVVLTGTPFTSYPGTERYPALSPDGTQVAFSWDGEQQNYRHIYLRQANRSAPLRLTSGEVIDTYAAWSPDGSTLAFVRHADQTGIYTVPSIGGQVRRLILTDAGISGLDWSPDGRQIAFASPPDNGLYHRITLLALETLETTLLTTEPGEPICDWMPRFSPDGQTVAFTRSAAPAFLQDIWLIPTAGGEARQLTFNQRRLDGLDWYPDGRQIIYAASPGADFNLWRVNVDHGTVTWLPTRGSWVKRPSVATCGGRLIYEDNSFEYNIWHVTRSDSGDSLSAPRPLITSTRLDHSANFSPDGTHIAFVSTRSGHHEIWTCDRDGRHPEQLAEFGGTYLTNPRWSPDGTQIAFTAFPEGFAAVYRIDVATGLPQRCSEGDRHEILSGWSRDGQWLYFDCDRGAGRQIWRMRPDGSQAALLSPAGIELLHEAPDGKHFYCYHCEQNGIWRMSPNGEMECVVDGDRMANWVTWHINDDGIYFLQRTRGDTALALTPFGDGAPVILKRFRDFFGYDLTVSPDGDTFLFDRAERAACDLILVAGEF